MNSCPLFDWGPFFAFSFLFISFSWIVWRMLKRDERDKTEQPKPTDDEQIRWDEDYIKRHKEIEQWKRKPRK